MTLINSNQIVMYLIGKEGTNIVLDDNTTIVEAIATLDLFILPLYSIGDISEDISLEDTGFLEQSIFDTSTKAKKIKVIGSLKDLQQLDYLNEDDDWIIFEVYVDGSVGGIPIYNEDDVTTITQIQGFAANLSYLDVIRDATDTQPMHREGYIVYKYASEFSSTFGIARPSFDIFELTPLRQVQLISFSGSIAVEILTGYQPFDENKKILVSGLQDDFKYNDDTEAIDIIEDPIGFYTGFTNDPGIITLKTAIDQAGDSKYIANMYIAVPNLWSIDDLDNYAIDDFDNYAIT